MAATPRPELYELDGMYMKKGLRIGLLLALCAGIALVQQEVGFSEESVQREIFIIGNRDLPFDTLTRSDVKNIFSMKKTRWQGNFQLNFAILSGGETHNLFVLRYLRKTPAQYRRYWKKLVFSGKGVQPLSFRKEKDLMAHVSLTMGALGYISQQPKRRGVKIIKIIDG